MKNIKYVPKGTTEHWALTNKLNKILKCSKVSQKLNLRHCKFCILKIPKPTSS